MTNFKAELQGWEQAVAGAQYGSLEYAVNDALGAAIDNANQTDGVAPESPEWFRAAHDSIAFTSAFDGNAEVRAWFAARGYSW